ncbi:hypothetical protein J1614_007936 [Plenodomus biglobosus]|nr:hypothetical protein J1614_007936 [Plenodomus biglobosus]
MTTLYSTLLCAATVTAQLTTSLLMPMGSYGTDKLGFFGSVIDANSTYTTIALEYDNGTDWEALELPRNATPATVTIGPNVYEASQDLDYLAQGIRTAGGDYKYSVYCDMPTEPTTNATCTATYGPLAGSTVQCEFGGIYTSTDFVAYTHSYTQRGSVSGGVETLIRTNVYPGPDQNRPDWCIDEAYLPTESYTSSYQVQPTYIAMYQVVITAGEEKLSGMSRASAMPGTATPTSSPVSPGSIVGSVATPTETGAAVRMVTGGGGVMFGVVAAVMFMM